MAARWIPDPKVGGSNPSSLMFYYQTGHWSRGMIPALGAGGREFESRMAPLYFDYPMVTLLISNRRPIYQ